MNLQRISAVYYRYYLLVKENPQRLIQIFFWSSIQVVIWGFITMYLNSVSGVKGGVMQSLLSAVVLWHLLERTVQGFTVPFLEESWSRNLLNLFTTPIRLREYVAGLGLVSVVSTVIAGVVLFLIAHLFFGVWVLDAGPLLFTAVPTLIISGIVVGIYGVALVLRFGPSGEWYIWPIPAVILPFCAVFYPVSILPLWMQWCAWALPPTYIFEHMRGEGGDMYALTGLMLAFLHCALAYYILQRIYARAIRDGAIARYGSEAM